MADPKDQTAAQIQQGLLAGKYRSPEDLAAAYTELEKKLGEMGAKHQAELAQVQAQQESYRQAAEWAQQNGPQLIQAVQQQQAQLQQLQAQRQQAQQPGADPLAWIRPEERQALYQHFARQYHQEGLLPTMQQMWQREAMPYVQQQVKAAQDQLGAQQKAIVQLLWQAVEHVAPPEKLEGVRKRQAAQLKYSDPATYDPNRFADEDVRRESDLLVAQERISALEKSIEEREKRAAQLPTAGGPGVSPFRSTEERKAVPKDRESRLSQVVRDVQAKEGPAFREVFPAAS